MKTNQCFFSCINIFKCTILSFLFISSNSKLFAEVSDTYSDYHQSESLLTGLPEVDMTNSRSRDSRSFYVGILNSQSNLSLSSFNDINYSSVISDKLDSGSIVNGFALGMKLSRHIAAEFSFLRNQGSSNPNTYGIASSTSTLNLMRYSLIYDTNILQEKFHNKLKMLFIGGIVVAGQDNEYLGTQTQTGIKEDLFGIGAELGTGISFNITENFVARADIRYAKVNMSDVVDNFMTISGGLYFYI